MVKMKSPRRKGFKMFSEDYVETAKSLGWVEVEKKKVEKKKLVKKTTKKDK